MNYSKEILYNKRQVFIRQYLWIKLFLDLVIITIKILDFYFYGIVTKYNTLLALVSFLSSLILLWKIDFLNNFKFKHLVNFNNCVQMAMIVYNSISKFPDFPITLIYLILFPISFSYVNNFKYTFLYSAFFFVVFLLVYSSFEWNSFPSWKSKDVNTVFFLWIYNLFSLYFHFFFFLFLLTFHIYYAIEFNSVKIQNNFEQKNETLEKEAPSLPVSEVKEDKLMLLYRRIIDYTEKDKFYLNSNASIYDLTQALNTNRTYISAALNQKGKTNFNDFINSYRINFVIQEFEKDIHKKYTLKVIYTSAGFVHQSQFNRAFKKIMGKSPREYLKEING